MHMHFASSVSHVPLTDLPTRPHSTDGRPRAPDDDNSYIPKALQPMVEWPIQGGVSIADYYNGLKHYPDAEACALSLVNWESLKAAPCPTLAALQPCG